MKILKCKQKQNMEENKFSTKKSSEASRVLFKGVCSFLYLSTSLV